jgi:Mg2+-importing ATPase
MKPPSGVAPHSFWTQSAPDLCARLQCTTEGLTDTEAQARLAQYGPNADAPPHAKGLLAAVGRRLREPLSLILLGAGAVSAATGDGVGGGIIVTILGLSIGLDTVQEGRANRAAEMLRRSVALRAEVLRGGVFRQVPVEEVVPGDVMRVRAGDIIAADALVLDSEAFTAGEAALTGEPYPVEKRPGVVTAASAGEASNALFRGAVAQTGEARALVVGTGRNTLFGAAAAVLGEGQEVSAFQRDMHAFGLITARLTLALVVVVLATHMLFGRQVLESLMFAVALAVGLTPELLPMITTVTLSHGALRMAGRKVIVKRLAAIHDLGAMTVLCTDKTGTLTSAEIALSRSLDAAGQDDPQAARLGAIAASLGGDRGALDAALMASHPDAAQGWKMLQRHAFDFTRRVGSVWAEAPDASDVPDGRLLIVKGAPEAVLALCTRHRVGGALQPLDDAGRAQGLARVHALAQDGLRVVAVASCKRPDTASAAQALTVADETDLVLEGLCAFADPAKPTAAAAIARLSAAGVRLKILSGDDPIVVQRLAQQVGLRAERVLTGADVAALSDDALAVQVQSVDIYGRLAPDQKARLVRALKAHGAVVGFLGDGINDAPALKVADIGLSVEGASGVAQAAADMILLASDLQVVADGVEEGRRTFVNILKYVRMGASSNFGNMLSMAVASLFLPFLPMLPTQILLNNLLYDFSEIGIPLDRVSPEAIAQPQVWDMRGLLRFAGTMGPLSSLFDLATFGGLLWLFQATPEEFRTMWFMESMATQILVIFIIRTRARPWRDLAHPALVASSLIALLVAMALPFTPVGAWFGFVAPPADMLAGMGALVLGYLVCAQWLKAHALADRSSPLAPRH